MPKTRFSRKTKDKLKKSRKRKKGSEKKKYPPQSAIQKAGHKMKEEPPKILAKTRKKFGKERAEKQRVAIMLDKARRGDG